MLRFFIIQKIRAVCMIFFALFLLGQYKMQYTVRKAEKGENGLKQLSPLERAVAVSYTHLPQLKIIPLNLNR